MTVLYEVRDRIAFISFNRPEKHNALRDEDIASLIDALQRLDGDDDADVAILFGQGKSFSSGGDVNDRLQRSMDEGSTRGRTNEQSAFTQSTSWKPVIVAVHGYCLGHALGTALYCDHLVAATDTVFEFTEIKLGLPTARLHPSSRRTGVRDRRDDDGPPLHRGRGVGGRRRHPPGRGARAPRSRRGARAPVARAAAVGHPSERACATQILAEESARYQAVPPGWSWAEDAEAQAAVAKLSARSD